MGFFFFLVTLKVRISHDITDDYHLEIFILAVRLRRTAVGDQKTSKIIGTLCSEVLLILKWSPKILQI